MAAPLRSLAQRIGENREVAGVHFPSDREVSEKLVPLTMAALDQSAKFRDLVVRARAEFPAFQTAG